MAIFDHHYRMASKLSSCSATVHRAASALPMRMPACHDCFRRMVTAAAPCLSRQTLQQQQQKLFASASSAWRTVLTSAQSLRDMSDRTRGCLQITPVVHQAICHSMH